MAKYISHLLSNSMGKILTLFNLQVCSVDQSSELESFIASPDVKIYFYGPVSVNCSDFCSKYCKKLEHIKLTVSFHLIDFISVEHFLFHL